MAASNWAVRNSTWKYRNGCWLAEKWDSPTREEGREGKREIEREIERAL